MSIRERVLSRADLAAAYKSHDLDALVAGLNIKPDYALTETWVDALGLINRCKTGKSILRKLKAGSSLDAVIEVAWYAMLNLKGLDFGAQSMLDSIDEMAPVLGFTLDELNEMKSLGMQPVYVTRQQVADALYNPDGSEK